MESIGYALTLGVIGSGTVAVIRFVSARAPLAKKPLVTTPFNSGAAVS